ncbi:MAG: hypothetical protein K9N34_09580 [Candidatus Marinimicrobia bacterium]|nr:hypothetical protein [Candidatus Neomarinimicrobiota bacterium]MCF7840554.1 hypothetical protein [Candidatus Neomarinimicrobiota bacterium]
MRNTFRLVVMLTGLLTLAWAQSNIKVTCNVRNAEFYYVSTTAGGIQYLDENGLQNFLESQRGKLKGPFIFDFEIALANVGGPDETHFFVLLRKKGYRDYYKIYPVQPNIDITWHSKRGPIYYPLTPVLGVIPGVVMPFGTPQFVQDKSSRGKFHLWTQILTVGAATTFNFLAEDARSKHLDARERSMDMSLPLEERITAAQDDNEYIDQYDQFVQYGQYAVMAFGALYTWQFLEGLLATPGVNSPNWENPKPLFTGGVSLTGSPMLAAGIQINF